LFTLRDKNAKHLEDLSNQILSTIWRSNPIWATVLGVREYDNTLGDASGSAISAHCRSLRSCVEALQTQIDPSLLDADQEMNRRTAMALANSYLIMFEQQRYWEIDPSVYSSQAVWACQGLLMRNPESPQEMLPPILSRMREIPEMLSAGRANIRNPAQVFVQLAFVMNRQAISFFRNDLPAIAEGSPLSSEIRSSGERIIKALEDYDEWLRSDVMPFANGDFGIGKAAYERMLTDEYCLTCTSSDLVSMAESILAETQCRIAEAARAIDPSVTWVELIARLKQEHPPKDGIVDAYRQAFESARDFVLEHDLATLPDDATLTVGITPEVERSVLPYAAYFPPAPFGESKRGSIWVTPIEDSSSEEQQQAQLLEHCIYSIPVLALHEGIPGHHLQLTRAMESPHLVRRQMLSSLLMEGWALYCEQLMREQGYYNDPRIELFQLKDMIWRACRVIIDVGLHTGGMTLDEAVRMLVDRVCIEESVAAAEVKRYAMSPTQPMTYLVGKLMLLDLRDRMERRLGSRFNLKSFHDEFLSFGSVPPTLIIERMTGDGACKQPEVRLRRSA